MGLTPLENYQQRQIYGIYGGFILHPMENYLDGHSFVSKQEAS